MVLPVLKHNKRQKQKSLHNQTQCIYFQYFQEYEKEKELDRQKQIKWKRKNIDKGAKAKTGSGGKKKGSAAENGDSQTSLPEPSRRRPDTKTQEVRDPPTSAVKDTSQERQHIDTTQELFTATRPTLTPVSLPEEEKIHVESAEDSD